MEFMESLYEIENFGIYLFIVIGILVLAFLITLFFGRKDSKKTEEVNEEVKEPVMDTFAETSVAQSVEVPKEEIIEPVNTEVKENIPVFETPSEVVAPILDEVKDDTIVVPPIKEEAPLFAEVKEEAPLFTEAKEEKPVVEANNEEIINKTFDFDALADAISKELDDVEAQVGKKEEAPSIVKEEPIKVQRPEVFSSVFVNRAKETEVKPDVSSGLEFDLPKKVELPKTKE